ncbi:MAG TPA: hypothetical protein VIS72_11160 [Anaerolineales bacterium]
MSHAATQKQHHFPVSVIVSLVIVIVVIGVFIAMPYVTSPQAAIIPVTGNQNAYAEFLRGEKKVFAVPVNISDAMTTYRLGEKTINTIAISSSGALTAYHLGEKNNVSMREYALLIYRSGEKDY